MPLLAISCFGSFRATLDGERLAAFARVKAQALLAYLVLEAARPHYRDQLATLLWPLDAESSARNNLRQTLYELRKLLGDRDDLAKPFLLVTRQTVQFNASADYALDVADFQAHLRQGQLAQAAALYEGDLLAGLLCESEPFEEWLRQQCAYFHNLAVDVYFRLTDQALQQGDFTQARTYAQRQLTLEPWREEAHRQLMTALALSGERSTALAQYDTCRRILAVELGVEPDSETNALYEQIKAGKLRGQRAVPLPLPVVSEGPVTRSTLPSTARHNLPTQPTAFIGRQTDLAQIAARLSDPTCRLLTIVGPGGMGKTRLAIQAAQTYTDSGQPHFPDGIFFVGLAGVASSDLLVSTIATALNFTFYGSAEPETQLQGYLRTRSALIVLDNCEHLLDGIELISDLLGAAPQLKVLATSREPLNLREEWLHPLAGMSFPSEDTAVPGTKPALLTQYTALQLFVQCARQWQPTFDLAAEGNAVAQVCRLLEGMPLAIELAATWLKFYRCAQIAQEVTRDLDLLATKLRNVSPRHRSMRAVFEHSWGLLSPDEQQVLRHLAVFRGGFSQEAATQVTGASLPLLLTLVEKSLVQLTVDRRFQVHELLRQFAEEKLRADPAEAERMLDEHCRYYCTWLSQQEAHLKGPGHLTAMQAIEREIENVRAAWERAVAGDHLAELERALEGLSYFYDVNCWYEQGMELFQHMVAALAPHQSDERHRLLFARALTKQARVQMQLIQEMNRVSLRESTQALADQALVILQDYGETVAYAEALWEWNGLRSRETYLPWAEPWLTAAAIFEQHNDYWRLAQALEGLGFQANLLGQHEQAIQYYERGILLCEQIGDQRVLGDILNIYGEALRAVGEYEEAMRRA
jgi:predicted ATPase/DNA-binding SARP family transcriptional activator